MIFVDRSTTKEPPYFQSIEFGKKLKELEDYYHKPYEDRAQTRYYGYKLSLNTILKAQEVFNGKCAYCESKVEIDTNSKYDGINHFRPKASAKGYDGDMTTSIDHYWWLTYEWGNIYYCCIHCNRFKGSWFPVKGNRSKRKTPYFNIIEEENNLILDPCRDDISSNLFFNLDNGEIVSHSAEGRTTIKILNLNRTRLVANRMFALKEERKNWSTFIGLDTRKKDKAEEILIEWTAIFEGSSKKEFLAIRRAFLSNEINSHFNIVLDFLNNVDLNQYVDSIKRFASYGNLESSKQIIDSNIQEDLNSVEIFDDLDITSNELLSDDIKVASNIREVYRLKNIYIREIRLKNYKCFEKLTINFENIHHSVNEPWIVFLGENGVGKSSLLKAISIALMGQKYLDKLDFKASNLLRYNTSSGYIKLYGTQKDEAYEVSFKKNDDKITSNIILPASRIIGYGSTRLLPKGLLVSEPLTSFVKSKNLFDYSIALSDAKQWLLNASEIMFNQVSISLKDLLLLDDNDKIIRNKKKDTIRVVSNNLNYSMDIEELSDGYKSVFAISTDIIQTLSKDNIVFDKAEGIVLIDEIGTHLHPRWKMEVVNRLRRTFPKIQFIVTTHEPLCLRGLEKNEVIVLKRNEEKKIIAINDLPNPSDLRVDQLLTSEYFGLNSTLDFETEVLFKEYYNLLAKEDRSNEEQNRVSELNQILPNKKHIGDDIRDELVYYVIDELLAKQVKKEGFKMANDEIKKEALDRVKDIWNFIDNND
ncbi:AAA family ATPase [uncultured Croceitalea sp.]|uniref:AAA family ATPase n=1 Tax=uncultured Croceitalea sp. TaxID=1798908 RepID=UPI003305911E